VSHLQPEPHPYPGYAHHTPPGYAPPTHLLHQHPLGPPPEVPSSTASYNFAAGKLILWIHCKKNVRNSCLFFHQTFLGLGLGKSFPARESLVSGIPAGVGNPQNLFLQCMDTIGLVSVCNCGSVHINY